MSVKPGHTHDQVKNPFSKDSELVKMATVNLLTCGVVGPDRKTILWQSSSVSRLEKWPMVRMRIGEMKR